MSRVNFMEQAQSVVQVVAPSAAVVAPAQASVDDHVKKPARQKKATAPRKRAAKKEQKIILVKSKRKEAIARASVKVGAGRVRVNGVDINATEQDIYRSVMREPIDLSNITRELAGRLEITINVKGGGSSSQAQAVRSAIAKGISKFAESDTIRKEYMRYDKALLVDDYRRVEPKKYLGPKARARNQTSYR